MNFMKTILILLFSVPFVNLNGQESRFSIGIKALPGLTKGLTHTNLTNSFLNDSKYDTSRFARPTLNYGIAFNYQIIPSKLFIETGLYYSSRGSVMKNYSKTYLTGSPGQGGYTYYEFKTDILIYDYYLTLPLLFGYKYKSFYASIGPTFGYNLFKQWKYTSEAFKTIYDTWKQLGFFNNVSIGLDLNIGTAIKLNQKFDLILEGGFEISNFKNDQGQTFYYKNSEIGIGINYKF